MFLTVDPCHENGLAANPAYSREKSLNLVMNSSADATS